MEIIKGKTRSFAEVGVQTNGFKIVNFSKTSRRVVIFFLFFLFFVRYKKLTSGIGNQPKSKADVSDLNKKGLEIWVNERREIIGPFWETMSFCWFSFRFLNYLIWKLALENPENRSKWTVRVLVTTAQQRKFYLLLQKCNLAPSGLTG